MTIVEFLLLILVAGVCRSVAQALAGVSRGGCLVSIALGFSGPLVATWLARSLELPELFTLEFGSQPFPIVWSIVGASLFAAILALLTRNRNPQ